MLADALGVIVAQIRDEWRKEMGRLTAETRAVIAEIRAAAIEALLEQQAPEKAARLRAIGGRRAE